MNLLLLTEKDRVSGGIFQVGGRRAEHIKCVLRAKVGDTVRLPDGASITIRKISALPEALAKELSPED